MACWTFDDAPTLLIDPPRAGAPHSRRLAGGSAALTRRARPVLFDLLTPRLTFRRSRVTSLAPRLTFRTPRMRPPTPFSAQNCPLEALSRAFMASGDQSLDAPEVMFDLKRSKVTSRTSKDTSRTSNDAPGTSNDGPDTSNDRSGRSNNRPAASNESPGAS